jgi:hypothetical protein
LVWLRFEPLLQTLRSSLRRRVEDADCGTWWCLLDINFPLLAGDDATIDAGTIQRFPINFAGTFLFLPHLIVVGMDAS